MGELRLSERTMVDKEISIYDYEHSEQGHFSGPYFPVG